MVSQDQSPQKRRIFRQLSSFTKKEIELAFKKASVLLKRSELTILVSPRQYDYSRILIITPRAIGTAPVRNKLRRRLKTIFYEANLYTEACDYIIIARKGVADFSFDQLKKLLLSPA